MAFNDDPSRKSTALSISGSFGFRWDCIWGHSDTGNRCDRDSQER